MRVLAAILSAALLAPVSAQAADLVIKDGWFRALPTGLPAGGYFTLLNNGDKAETLTSAESSSCGMMMLHKTETSGGVSRMDMVSNVPVPAHGTLSFSPGGLHLMCMSPTPEVSAGSTISVTLHFADGSSVSADFAVKGANGQ